MTSSDDPHHRKPKLLIPDTAPLSLLAMAGDDALDWLFVPGAEVWVTDMVKEEATREPDPGDDQRSKQRECLKEWFDRNRNRIGIQKTTEGEEYKKAMLTWALAGKRPELKPSWRGRGERSIQDVLRAVGKILEKDEGVIILTDDERFRAALKTMDGIDMDLMATQSFIHMIESRFSVKEAGHAWIVIREAAGKNEAGASRAPEAPEDDPVFIRTRK